MALKAVDAAFAGFGIIRREPLTVAGWGLASVLLGAAFMGAFMLLGLQGLVMPTPGAPPAETLALVRPLLGIGALGLGVALVSYSVGICAVYRTILRPEETGWARLRLGADEFRMMLLMVVLWLLLMVAYLAFVLVIIVGGAVIGVAALGVGAGKGDPAGAMAGVVLTVVALYFAFLAFIIWFGVAFSMAAPMTFDKRELYVFRSRKVVKGHFWSLTGCFVLATVVTSLIYCVVIAVQSALMAVVGGPGIFSALAHPETPPTMAAYFAPGPLAVTLALSFVSVAFYALLFAPAAAAYREIVGVSPAVQAETFT